MKKHFQISIIVGAKKGIRRDMAYFLAFLINGATYNEIWRNTGILLRFEYYIPLHRYENTVQYVLPGFLFHLSARSSKRIHLLFEWVWLFGQAKKLIWMLIERTGESLTEMKTLYKANFSLLCRVRRNRQWKFGFAFFWWRQKHVHVILFKWQWKPHTQKPTIC